jgi:hypothetical protein
MAKPRKPKPPPVDPEIARRSVELAEAFARAKAGEEVLIDLPRHRMAAVIVGNFAKAPAAGSAGEDDEPEDDDETPMEFDIELYTGSAVTRYGWDGRYEMVLEMAPENVRLDRLKSGTAPFKAGHGDFSGDPNCVIGVLKTAELRDGKLVCRVRMAMTPDTENLRAKIAQGICRNVSVEFDPLLLTVEEREGKCDLVHVTLWDPSGGALVDTGADPNAHTPLDFRHAAGFAANQETTPCRVTAAHPQRKDQTMSETTPNPTTPGVETPPPPPAPTVDFTAERERADAILAYGERFSLDPAKVRAAVKGGMSLDAFRAQVLDGLAGTPVPRSTVTTSEVSAPEQTFAAQAEALFWKNPGAFQIAQRIVKDRPDLAARFKITAEPSPQARESLHLSLLDFAHERLRACGQAGKIDRMDPMATVKFAQDVSDFPRLLENALNKGLLPAYLYAESTFQEVSRAQTFNDFREHKFYRPGDFPVPKRVYGGRIEAGNLGDAAREAATLYPYGIRAGLSREAIVNDDLNAFNDIPAAAGQTIKYHQNFLFWAMVLSNPTMGDSVAMFDAAHGNLAGSGAAPSLAAFGAAEAAMAKQKSTGGVIPVTVKPAIVVHGPDTTDAIEQILVGTIYATAVGQVNRFYGKWHGVMDPNITDYRWYVVTAPAENPAFLHGFLRNQPGPRFEQWQAQEIDGVEFRAMHDFGCAPRDWRFAYMNPGEAPE